MNVVAFAPVRASSRTTPDADSDARVRPPRTVKRADTREPGDPMRPDAPEIDAAVERVVASPTFRHSKRHQAFLAYLVDAVLDGRGASLKEVVIGLEVFGRCLNGYDPDRDSIVRVEARRLRGKLARYYATEGRADPLVIRLPVGRYAPVFERRTSSEVAHAASPLFVVIPLLTIVGDERHAASAVAIADRVVHRLGEIDGLRVMAPVAAATLRGQPIGFADFAKAQGVDYVVDGTLISHGPRVRCIVHLSRLQDRSRVWSGHFDLQPAAGADGIDWLAAQDRIADELAAAVTKAIDARGIPR